MCLIVFNLCNVIMNRDWKNRICKNRNGTLWEREYSERLRLETEAILILRIDRIDRIPIRRSDFLPERNCVYGTRSWWNCRLSAEFEDERSWTYFGGLDLMPGLRPWGSHEPECTCFLRIQKNSQGNSILIEVSKGIQEWRQWICCRREWRFLLELRVFEKERL